MDIDAMAPKERQRHQELGLCFYCHKQGHLFRQCPERDKKRKENPKRRQPRITQSKALYIPLTVRGVHKDIDIEALIDSSVMATYIRPRLVIKLRLSTTPLARPIPVFNVDDTPNKKGTITHSVAL
ncbi:hypothetical protein DAEQUDRAFT_660899 [Daedalea quercina L-15889]|uniref:CCHC-type domain-containing protein n=1 Tax=Daedalea quercina L-15889 TaxID=1314783 RepID=A0A165TZJ4_9APHY|nr:hypothetical protein DAEQUDRAFT_660899 [Daedalea quercina L-15889]